MALSAGRRLLLVDKSAFVRGAADADVEGELCLCAVTRMELLSSARSADDFAGVEAELGAFRELRMDAETFAIAAGAQRELAARGCHRVALPDLLVAACAQQHAADVLHVDRHFDVLAGVLAFGAVRLAPPGEPRVSPSSGRGRTPRRASGRPGRDPP